MKKLKYLFLLSSISFIPDLYAQPNFWRGQSREVINKNNLVERRQQPNNSLQIQLNYQLFVNYLNDDNRINKTLKFPNSKGEFEDYILQEESSLHPTLQKKYPEIKSFVGTNTKNPQEKIYLNYSPYFGLFANIVGENKNLIIDPLTKDKTSYLVYEKSDLSINADQFICNSEQENKSINLGIDNLDFQKSKLRTSSTTNYLRKFRMAVATSTEYSDFIIQRAGLGNATEKEKKAAILAAVNVSINRINGILKNDVGVILELIPTTDQLFFIDSDTYEISNVYQMIDENVVVTNRIIGSANYDIGHLFFKVNSSRLSNGLANTPSVCEENYKAGGVTGTVIPIGDPFDIDYTAHEIGHQLGALHTQNNSCYRSQYGIEPGSGSTIMAYTGICKPNVQSNSDAYFHSKSIEQINYSLNLSLHNCAIKIPTNNSLPTILTQSKSFNIPHSTAFSLSMEAKDANNDELTYNWEQIDNSVGEVMPPLSSNKRGPMFRSFPASKNPERFFPKIEKIITDQIVFNSNYYNESENLYYLNNWEVVPNNARTLTFRGTVRDNNSEIGLNSTIDQTINIQSDGPFKVTSQTTNETWKVGNQVTITWDVANTNITPINTSNVKIVLSTDGGKTWNKTLVESTPNNGSYTFNVPSNLGITSNARIMIRAVDNIYLAVNSSNFTIDSPLATNDIRQKDFTLYPNPSNGWITIKTKNSSSPLEIDVYDMTGRKVKSLKLNSTQTENKINLTDLSNGVYIIKSKIGSEENSQKLIIRK